MELYDDDPANFRIEGDSVKQYLGSSAAVMVPAGVRRLGMLCFHDMPFESVILPTGLTAIGFQAFLDCKDLVDIVFPETLREIRGEAFQGTPWLRERQAEDPLVIVNGIVADGSACTGEVIIPDGVRVVTEMAFRGNTKITSVYIPDSVQLMGNEIFDGCDALTRVSLPAGVKGIQRFRNNYCIVRQEEK
ncbi:MAG: leucine-rich repeat domain-containing protein [Oscillospiraceae bacterium]|nr:leucine-rich repeat domain-containing protein [Oscillospiraceae bacterium]